MKNEPTQTEFTQEQIQAVWSEKFPTVDDIISDRVFRSKLSAFMSDMISKRTTREAPPEGKKWVRDWLDTLIDKGMGKESNYIDEIENVLLKRSAMSSNVREQLKTITIHCINEACKEYVRTEPQTKAI